MMLEVKVAFSLACCACWTALRFLEDHQLWTLRLWLSSIFPATTFVLLATAATAHLVIEVQTRAGLSKDVRKAAVGMITTAFVALSFRLFLPLITSRGYVKLRWKAWSGHSRTGVPPHLTRYLGNRQDWLSMLASCDTIAPQSVERGLRFLPPFDTTINEDMTDILSARSSADDAADVVWVPRSATKAGAYQPIGQEQPASLLWGHSLGFKPRCSRGIISVPRNLLTYRPRLKNGLDGRPLCLAHAVLARNKGLVPQSLVCNLQVNGSYRKFEENSIFWPRPAKTYRSLYHAEMSRSFLGLGQAYVTAATELALLFADVEYNLVWDWLEGIMEHQDLSLNNEIAALGASPEELAVLYRGSYAAMLVSLSLHRLGVRVRPELAVFKALWQLERQGPLPQWLLVDGMQERHQQEKTILGANGMHLVEAII